MRSGGWYLGVAWFQAVVIGNAGSSDALRGLVQERGMIHRLGC